jgi:hypothetical protein
MPRSPSTTCPWNSTSAGSKAGVIRLQLSTPPGDGSSATDFTPAFCCIGGVRAPRWARVHVQRNTVHISISWYVLSP